MQFSDLDPDKTYSYADYYSWTFEERLELIKGKIFKMSPAPNRYHQEISGVVYYTMYNNLRGKPCKVYSAPFDVRLPRQAGNNDEKTIYTVVQPDVCVICDLSKLDTKGCIGAPDIVVEILSPSNNKKELQNKYEVYEEAGVLEYWIIHPAEKTFMKYVLINEKYQSTKLLTLGEMVTTPILPGFILDLEEVFADIP